MITLEAENYIFVHVKKVRNIFSKKSCSINKKKFQKYFLNFFAWAKNIILGGGIKECCAVGVWGGGKRIF
jgi:hypothetical protein